MKLVHIADTHLGYRAYHRVTRSGQNVREADVAAAFDQAIDKVVEIDPDLALIAGDVVHTVRPSNAVVSHAFRCLARLCEARPRLPVLIIAGNHDSPRSAETGNIISLFQEIPGVMAVTHTSQQVYLEELDTSVLCVPHNALAGGLRTALEPDPRASTNLLMLHGTVGGASAGAKIRFLANYGGEVIQDRTIAPERWDYVALGHYHIQTEIAPNMWYSGSLERTSSNIWIEKEPKGFLSYDTLTQVAQFHEVSTRPMIDLPTIDAEGLGVTEINERIQGAVEGIEGGIEAKIVRQVVVNLPRHLARELDHAQIRRYRAEALHFQLDTRGVRPTGAAVRQALSTRRTVEEEVVDFLQRRWPLSTPTVRRPDLLALAREYMPTNPEGS